MERAAAEELAERLTREADGLATYTVEQTEQPSLEVSGWYVKRHHVRDRTPERHVGDPLPEDDRL